MAILFLTLEPNMLALQVQVKLAKTKREAKKKAVYFFSVSYGQLFKRSLTKWFTFIKEFTSDWLSTIIQSLNNVSVTSADFCLFLVL